MLRTFYRGVAISRSFCTIPARNRQPFLYDYNSFRPYRPPAPQGKFLTPESEAFWSEIEKKGSVEVASQWKSEALTKDLVTSILLKMCSQSWFSEARKLSYWMDRHKPYELSDSDLMLRLEVLCRTGNWKAARFQFDKLSFKSEEAYVMLLEAFDGKRLNRDGMSFVNDLKKSNLPPSSRVYAALVRMYARLGLNDKALKYFNKFEASGLDMDASMCWVLLAHKDVFPLGINKVQASLSRLKVESSNGMDLLRVYAALGNADGVCRVWGEIRRMSPTVVEYLTASNALDSVGLAENAKDVRFELELKTLDMNYPQKLMLLKLYARNGMMQEAESLQEKLMKFKMDFELCHPLVDGYLRLGDFENALACFDRFVTSGREDARRPRQLVAESMAKLIKEGFSKRGDIPGAEKILGKVPGMQKANVYNALIQTHLCSQDPGYHLESRLDAANVVRTRKMDILLGKLRKKFPLPKEHVVEIKVNNFNKPVRTSRRSKRRRPPVSRFARSCQAAWLPRQLFRKNKTRKRQEKAEMDAWTFFCSKNGRNVPRV